MRRAENEDRESVAARWDWEAVWDWDWCAREEVRERASIESCFRCACEVVQWVRKKGREVESVNERGLYLDCCTRKGGDRLGRTEIILRCDQADPFSEGLCAR